MANSFSHHNNKQEKEEENVVLKVRSFKRDVPTYVNIILQTYILYECFFVILRPLFSRSFKVRFKFVVFRENYI